MAETCIVNLKCHIDITYNYQHVSQLKITVAFLKPRLQSSNAFEMYAGFITNQFSKIGDMKSENLGYFKTQFYQKVSKSREDFQFAVQKHTYQKVSIPRSHLRAPKFLQKGIVFIWPQKKGLYRRKELILFTWVLSHLLFWLHNIHILPSANVLPLDQPPWKFEPPLRKPENRDYIIEPDWESKNY